ncbi:MAG: 4-alpha-glucanotransferase [Spirochaetota bacterium]
MTAAETNPLREKIRSQKRAGVALPLLSLVSQESFECGDFYSLQLLKDWAKGTGLSIVQILPLNDLGNGRSPYSSISAFAIDPIYISLKLLGLPQRSRSKSIKATKINIARVRELKLSYLYSQYQKIVNEDLQKELKGFLQAQKVWLPVYAAFKILYDRNSGNHWKEWQYGSVFSDSLVEEIRKENPGVFYFHVWVQSLAFQQLSACKKLYEQDGVFLKGDLPILTSGNSADVWSKPHFFNMNMTAGAPPDYFNANGQNWGFPVLEWSHMKQVSYSWWQERLAYVEHFYHLYRIDHVLGMFRIWAIPLGSDSAKKGFFYPQHGVLREDFEKKGLNPDEYIKRNLIYEFSPGRYIFYWDFWKEHSYQELPEEIKAPLYPLSHEYLEKDEAMWREAGEHVLQCLLQSSGMLPCVEDLGAVPEFVRDTIHHKQLIGIDVIRWTRSFEDGSYIGAGGYRKNAVSTLSVHDTSIATAWWEEGDDNDRHALQELLGLHGEFSKGQLLEAMLKFSLQTNSIFSINLLQDFILEEGFNSFHDAESDLDILANPTKHRINVPGTPDTKNWGYRYPFHVEQLLGAKDLASKILTFVKESKRV